MTKNKISRKKLIFNKQTVANLNDPSMNRVIGGILQTLEDCTPAMTHGHPACMPANVSEVPCESQEPGEVCPSQEPGCPPPDTV